MSTCLSILNMEGQITNTQENKNGDGKGHLHPVITSLVRCSFKDV